MEELRNKLEACARRCGSSTVIVKIEDKASEEEKLKQLKQSGIIIEYSVCSYFGEEHWECSLKKEFGSTPTSPTHVWTKKGDFDMAGRLIIHAPTSYMGVLKLNIYLNGEKVQSIGRNGTAYFDIDKPTTVQVNVGFYGKSEVVMVEPESTTTLVVSMHPLTWKCTFGHGYKEPRLPAFLRSEAIPITLLVIILTAFFFFLAFNTGGGGSTGKCSVCGGSGLVGFFETCPVCKGGGVDFH